MISAPKRCFSCERTTRTRAGPAEVALQPLGPLLRELRREGVTWTLRPRAFDRHGSSFLSESSAFVCDDEGMRSSSRYLATVRRAIWIPSARSRCMIRASECGRRGSSSAMIREILFLIDSEETSSPVDESMPLWKKYFIGKSPRGVWMYLFDTTRDTVDSCMPMSLATSRSTSGRRCSMPWSRKPR